MSHAADEPDPLSQKQLALLEALRAVERSGAWVDFDAIAAASGYTSSSVRTYFTKRLEGVLAFRDDAGRWRVKGAIATTSEAFARRMSQKAGASSDALRDQDSWRALLRKLLYEGQRRRYALTQEEVDLVNALPIVNFRPTGGDESVLPLTLFDDDLP